MTSKFRMSKDQLRKKHYKWRFHYLKDHMLPCDKCNYYSTLYYNWVERIKKTKDDELQWIKELPQEKLVDDMGDFRYAEEVCQIDSLVDDMCASYVVSIWRKVEDFLKKINNFFPAKLSNDSFAAIKKTFEKRINIYFADMPGYDYVNSVRILNNCFKHHDKFYYCNSAKIPKKLDIIPDSFLEEFDLEKNDFIDYKKLDLEKLTLECGRFCHEIYKIATEKLQENDFYWGTEETVEEPDDIENIKELIESAVEQLYEKDYYLIEHGLWEVCITHRLAIYIEKQFKDSPYDRLNVDIEYNKDGYGEKKIVVDENGKRPDIIIHKRGVNTNNLLIVEMKKNTVSDSEDDKKLCCATEQTSKFKYKLGLFLNIMKDSVEYTWYVDGKAEEKHP